MSFALLFCIFLIIGIFYAINSRRAILFFIFISITIPSGNAFSSFTYSNGIYVMDAFFLAIMMITLVRISILHKIQLSKLEIITLFITFFIFSIYFLFSVYNMGFEIKKLKELRPFLMLVEVLVFSIAIRQISFNISFNTISKLAIVAAISNLIYFAILFFDIVIPPDIFYENNSYRYLDLSTYFSVYFIIHYFFIREKKLVANSLCQKLAFFLSLLSILISNSRFLILSLIIALILSNITTISVFFKRISLGFFMILLLIAFSYVIDSTRVYNALSIDAIIVQLSGRYLPAILDIYDMSNTQRLFGYGIGHYFEIPWFEYRDEIENSNISIDCAYLTVYVKQGVLGILVLLLTTKILIRVKNIKHKYTLFIFWGMMFIVSSSFYHVYPFGAILYNSFLENNETV